MNEAKDDNAVLPVGWICINLEDISEIVMGQSPPGDSYNQEEQGIPLINGPVEFGPTPFSKTIRSKFTTKPTKMCLQNDLLLCVRGSTTGRMNISGFDACIGRGVAAIRSPLCQPYINYFIHSIQYRIFQMGTGSTFPNVTMDTLRSINIPIPPIDEQHRIVARIEELFSRLDAGVEELKKAKVQLQRYRQSVLKAAVDGRLTAEWRKAHPEVEPAEGLLIRIADKQHYGKRKAKDTLNCDLYEMPNFPVSWTWTRIGDISDLIQYGTSEKAGDDPTGIPIMRMGNIQEGKLTFEKLKYMRKDYSEMGRFFLRNGDILFNRTNSAELVGKTAVYKNYPNKSIFASYLIRLEVDRDFYNPDFLSYFINSSYGRKYIATVVSQQVGQANVNGTKLASMTIPLPPIKEQKEIVEYVEHSRSASEDAEANIERIRNHTAYLRQSVLRSAFEGTLVPQDPKDEPASMLLERIKADQPRIGLGKDKRYRARPIKEFSG